MACFVPYCKTGNNSQKKPAGVHEHRFPPKTSPALRQKWLDQINRVLTRPLSDRDYVCTLHFDPNDIVPDDENYDKRGRKRKKKFLKHLAYPKLQLGRPPPVIKERPKNKNQSPPISMPMIACLEMNSILCQMTTYLQMKSSHLKLQLHKTMMVWQ